MLNFVFTQPAKAAEDTNWKLVRVSIEADNWVEPKEYTCSLFLGNPTTMQTTTRQFKITTVQAQEIQPIIQAWMKSEVMPDLKAVSAIEIKEEAK